MAVSLTLVQWHPDTDWCGNGYTDWSPNLAPITDSSCDSKHVAALLWPQSSHIGNGRVNQMLFTSLLYIESWHSKISHVYSLHITPFRRSLG